MAEDDQMIYFDRYKCSIYLLSEMMLQNVDTIKDVTIHTSVTVETVFATLIEKVCRFFFFTMIINLRQFNLRQLFLFYR